MLKPFYDSIKKIKLASGNITQVPELICKCKKLDFLSFEKNKVKNFPKCISDIQTLKEVNFSFNDLKALPIDFVWDKLTNLEILSLKNNVELTDGFPQLSRLSTLKYFDSSYTGFEELPGVWSSMNNLVYLKSSYGRLKKATVNAPSVKNVDLSYNNLDELDLFGSVTNAFDCSNNKLSSLPKGTSDVLKDAKIVNLSANLLSSLPALTFPKATFLDLSGNVFSELSNTIIAPKLTTLKIGNKNKLKSCIMKNRFIEGISHEVNFTLDGFFKTLPKELLRGDYPNISGSNLHLDEITIDSTFTKMTDFLCSVNVSSVVFDNYSLPNIEKFQNNELIKRITFKNVMRTKCPELHQFQNVGEMIFIDNRFPLAGKSIANSKVTKLTISGMKVSLSMFEIPSVSILNLTDSDVTGALPEMQSLRELIIDRARLSKETWSSISRLLSLRKISAVGATFTDINWIPASVEELDIRAGLLNVSRSVSNIVPSFPNSVNVKYGELIDSARISQSNDFAQAKLDHGGVLIANDKQKNLPNAGTYHLKRVQSSHRVASIMETALESRKPNNAASKKSPVRSSWFGGSISKGPATHKLKSYNSFGENNFSLIPTLDEIKAREQLINVNKLSSLTVLHVDASQEVIGLDAAHNICDLTIGSIPNNFNCSSIITMRLLNSFNSRIHCPALEFLDISNISYPDVPSLEKMPRLRRLVIPASEAEQPDIVNKAFKLNVQHIDYSASALTFSDSGTVPDAVTDQLQLTSLVLKNVQCIPETVTNLINLETIDFTECPSIGEIPRFLLTMNDKLKIKSSIQLFKTNKVHELQLFLEKVDAPIKVLDLSGLDTDTLPMIGSLPYLEELILDNSMVVNVDSILGVKTIKILSILNVPNEFSFPNTFWREMQALDRIDAKIKHLDLSEKLDSSIPKVIKSLETLTSITVANNPRIKEVSDPLFYLANLKVLDLSNTSVTTLKPSVSTDSNATPPSIDNLRKLEVIDVTKTPLDELPKELLKIQSLTAIKADESITSLDLSGALEGNQPPSGFYSLTQLKSLDLSSNNLTYIDPNLFSLTNLEVLNCAHNMIFNVSTEIKKLVKLKELNLSGNLLRSLPRELIELPELKILNVEDNYLSSLPKASEFRNRDILLSLEDNCSSANSKKKMLGCGISYHDITKPFSSGRGIIKIGKVAWYIVLGVSILFGVIFCFYLIFDGTKKEKRRLQRQYEFAKKGILESESV